MAQRDPDAGPAQADSVRAELGYVLDRFDVDDLTAPGRAGAGLRALASGGCLEEILSEGERARISRVRLPGPGETVICKEGVGAGAGTRIRHEAAILRRLAGIPGVARLAGFTRPNAVVLHDEGDRALSELIAAGPVDVPHVLGIAHVLAGALAAVHRHGVVHRDVNPSNIMLAGPDGRPVLIDFDIATTVAHDRPSFAHHSEITGTLAYLAPEQTGRTGRPVDHRADLYAFGAVLHELLTGHPPFRQLDELHLVHDILVRLPAPVTETRPDSPPMLAAIVARLLAKEPDRRYQSADGLARDLDRVADDPGEIFELGEWDFPPRLSAPSTLVGRDAEIAALHTAFDAATSGNGHCVLVAGRPGVGKSALIDELKPVVAARGGWFVMGKAEQFRRDAAAGAAVAALRGIGRLLLAEPETALVTLRERLWSMLGPNAGLLATGVPEIAMLLGTSPEPDSDRPEERADTEPRLRQAMADLLRVVVSPERPVVLVIDDLQWADRGTLGLLDTLLGGGGVPGLLLVGAYRENELDAAHPLTAVLARWERLGLAGATLRLDNLPPARLGELLTGMLRLAAEPAAELAEAVRAWTAGNPFDTVELINTLRRDGVLVLGAAGWSWDRTAIRRYVGQGDVVDLLKERIAGLAPAARELLRVMACLGGDLRLDLLAGAVELTAEALADRLAEPLEDGLLILDQDGAGDSVRFRHDRVLQAAYDGLEAAGRAGLHRVLGRRLAALPGRDAEAAEQYLLVADADLADDAERDRVARLHQLAAAAARFASNYLAAERFLAAASRLREHLAAGPDDPALLAVRIQQHGVLYGLGRLADADEVYAAVAACCTDPLELAAAACLQVSSFSQRNRHREALDLGLALVGRLGVLVPAGDMAEDLPARLDELIKWAAGLELPADLERPESRDPRVRAVERLFSRMLPTAFFLGDRAAVSWIVLESRRMWAQHGPSGGLAATLSCVGLVAMPALNDFRIGYTVGSHVLAVAEQRGYEPDTSVLRHRHTLHILHWVEPLENSVGQAQQAREGLLHGGDLQMAAHTSGPMLGAVLDTGRSVETYAAQVDAAVSFAARTGNPHTVEQLLAHRQLARTLLGRTDVPGGFDDPAFDEQTHLAGLGTNLMAVGLYHIYRSVAAAIFGDAPALARHITEAIAMRRFVPGYPAALVQLLRALSLAIQLREPSLPDAAGAGTDRGATAASDVDPEAPAAELDACRDWLAARAADAPGNFRHLLLLVDAERAWAAGDFRAAVTAFDSAREAAPPGRPWHRALIAERAGRFYLAHHLQRASRRALTEARGYYGGWGAVAKTTLLDAEFGDLRAATELPEVPRGRTGRRTTTVRADAIDMVAILRASQALSSETNFDRLHAAIAEQLTTLTGATDVLIALRGDGDGDEQPSGPPGGGDWFLPSTGADGRPPVPIEEAGRLGLLPLTAFRYAERTRTPLLVDDAVADDRFARDRYFAQLQRCSLLVVPMLHKGSVRAVLVLANQAGGGAFTAARLDAVTLITGQLIVSLRNALLYGSLEQRVADRTAALATANRQLEELSGTDSLTELPNRRRFRYVLDAEWDRAMRTAGSLAVVMIDVDHFKLFNDHYGHLAGDDCLRRVAGALGDSTRRTTDLACRYGGEEFVIVLAGSDAAGAAVVAERARAAVAALALPHALSDPGVVTVSVGVAAALVTPSMVPDDLVARADAALYQAKRDGRNRIAVND